MRTVTTSKKLKESRGTLRTSTQASVSAVNSAQETISVQGRSGKTQIAHPFNTDNAWIRSIPTAGTRVTLQYNENTREYDFVAYVPSAVPSRIRKYSEGKGLYRGLTPGEHEIKSSGNAVSYWGSRCFQSTRAGAVKTVHDGENLEHVTRAPTHIVEGHRKRRDTLAHEQRFGVVKRPLTAATSMIVMKAPLSNPATGKFTYAYEWLVRLDNDNDAPLVDFRMGEVYDDVPLPGVPFAKPALGANGNPLRGRVKFHATQEPLGVGLDDSTDYEIDSYGNVNVTLAKVALIGFAMKIPTGSYNLNAAQTVEIQGKLGIALTSSTGAVEVNGTTGVHLTTKDVVTVKGSKGVDVDTPLEVTINGSKGVNVTSDSKIVVNGKGGVQLLGSMGSTGRKIASLESDPSTGIPLWLDPTLTC